MLRRTGYRNDFFVVLIMNTLYGIVYPVDNSLFWVKSDGQDMDSSENCVSVWNYAHVFSGRSGLLDVNQRKMQIVRALIHLTRVLLSENSLIFELCKFVL